MPTTTGVLSGSGVLLLHKLGQEIIRTWGCLTSLHWIPPSWNALSQHSARCPIKASSSRAHAAFQPDPHLCPFLCRQIPSALLTFARKAQFQREIWFCGSFLVPSAASVLCQKHFKGAWGLPVLCLPEPSSLNSYNPARKCLKACCCFLLLLILLQCLFWHKPPFSILLPCLGFWSKFN